MSDAGLKGEYFDNKDFTNYRLTRTDAQVNFAWGNGSPDPLVAADTFSVRWTGKLLAPTAGTYTLYTSTDDGVRLWVNNQLLVDKWVDQSAEWAGTPIALAAGQKYDLKMEFYENGWGATAQLKWAGPGIAKQVIPSTNLFQPAAEIRGTVFYDTDWDAVRDAGETGMSGYTVELDIAGGGTLTTLTAADGSYVLSDVPNGDHWLQVAPQGVIVSSSGTGPITIANGQSVTGKDLGMRATTEPADYIMRSLNLQPSNLPTSGGGLTADRTFSWYPYRFDQAGTATIDYRLSSDTAFDATDTFLGRESAPFPQHGTFAGSVALTVPPLAAGTWYVVAKIDPDNTVTTEGSEADNVIASNAITVGTPPAYGLRGEYFDNKDLTNSRLGRVDSQVNFSWGNGSPDPLVGADTFSVRWTGKVLAPATGSYTFYAATDDGVRLWVNGQLLIDKWVDQSTESASAATALTAGQKYDIKMEYYENGWGASAILKWAGPGIAKQVIPAANLFQPSASVTGRVWYDHDRDGVFDNSQFRKDRYASAGLAVGLTLSGGGAVYATTDATGTYTFNDVQPGSYAIGLAAIVQATYPLPSGTWAVTVTSGQSMTGKDLGYTEFSLKGLPDYGWNSLSATPATLPTSGGTVTLNRNVFAVGNYIGLPASSIAYRLSTDQTWSADDIAITATDNLPASMSSAVVDSMPATVTGTVGAVPQGTYYVLGMIDPNNTANAPDGEYDETNNFFVANQITVGTPPAYGLKGEYFDNKDLTSLKLTRTDSQVNFNWGNGSPDASLGVDTFSVRWTGKLLTPTTGTYTLYTSTDDGVRLWVGGKLYIDKWVDQGGTEWATIPFTATAGQKVDVMMEYYENGWGAMAQLKWAGPGIAKQVIPGSNLFMPATTGTITGTAFRDYDNDGTRDTIEPPLSAAQVLIDNDGDRDFSDGISPSTTDSSGTYTFSDLPAGTYILSMWGTERTVTLGTSETKSQDIPYYTYYHGFYGMNSVSAPANLSTAGGSVTFQRSYTVTSPGEPPVLGVDYVLSSNNDRYDISGTVIAHEDIPPAGWGVGTYSGSFTTNVGTLPAGTWYIKAHLLGPLSTVDAHYAAGNQVIVAPPTNGLRGEYFDNKDLTNPRLVRTDKTVNFAWGDGSPDTLIAADTFSVRWTGQIAAPTTGTYTFYTTTDDGVRLWINGVQVINKWQDQSTEWPSGQCWFAAGQKYDIKMEYYENGWGASAQLRWLGPGVAKQVVPESALFLPTAAIAGHVWEDYNLNPVQDGAEPNYPNMRMEIDTDGDRDFDDGVAPQYTDAAGNYRFDSLPAGTYIVRIPYPGTSYPTSAVRIVTLLAGQLVTGQDFAFFQGG